MSKNDFLSPYGTPKYESGVAMTASVATLAALKALAAGGPARVHGNMVDVDADGSRWMFHSSSALTSDGILVAAPDAGDGRWLRAPGVADLALPVAYTTADAAVLLTVPTGCRLLVRRGYWEVTTAFAGGSSSAIGLSGPSPANSKGDVHGGASGDVEATLTAGVKAGTVGADVAAGVLLIAADTVKFDRVTSVFTSGAGNAHLVVEILRNAGA
jgi:hypothetical protein